MQNFYRIAAVLAILVLWTSISLAQFTATGTVLGADDQPLSGAVISVKGTTTGSFSKEDGTFSQYIAEPEGTLIISIIGYSTVEVDVTEETAQGITVNLEEDIASMDEVVIVGYGAERRGSLTGSIAQVSGDAIEQVPFASVEQALQGNVAGVQSVMSNGQPGANVNILIRGQGSIGASSDPLFVIDGIPVVSGNLTNNAETSNPLATLNPNDIANVTVLKDAAATAIYGSRGSNGVILITTKSGRPGKTKINFRTQIGFNDWAVSDDNRLRGLTAEEYTHLYIEGYANRGEELQTTIDRFNGQFPDPETGLPAVDIIPDGNGGYSLGEVRVDTRWIDELSRQGLNQSYDLSFSGGNKNLTYFASASYFDQEAPIIYSELQRYSSRLNLSLQATNRLKFTNNLNISRTTQQGMNDATRWANPLYNGYLMAPVVPIRDAQGLFYDGHKSFFMGGNNPVGSLSGDDNQEWAMIRILDNLTGSYEIVDGLTFKSAWAFDLLNFQEFYFRNSRFGDGRNAQGIGAETNRNILNWIGTQTLTYGKTFADKHTILALAGYEAQKSQTRSVFTTAETYPHPSLRTLANAANPTGASSTLSEFSFTSWFGRLNYNFSEKYFLSGSLRRDGSSRFGMDNRYGTFWSVGGAWSLADESFLQGVNAINSLKLRASYGVTGNAGIGNYEAIATFSFSGVDYDGAPGGIPGQIGNTGLTWEQSKTFNVGVDFGVFGDRLTGTVEYFDRESDNLLLDVPISRTTGFASLLQNFGALRNSGWEITLNGEIISTQDFSWSLGGNVTFLQNEITKLTEDFTDGSKRRVEGLDYQTYFVYEWAGVDPENGAPLWYTDSTLTETSSDVNEIERFISDKTATPSAYGGVTTALSWKGISVNAQFNFSFDGWLYDATAWVLQGDGRFTPRSQTNLVLDRWQEPGDVTDVPQFEWGNRSSSNLRNSTRYIYDGSFIRLRNLTVAYNFPTELVNNIKLSSARLYFRGINMWTWTRDPDLYVDPEAAFSGVINSPVPNLKTLSIGLDLGF